MSFESDMESSKELRLASNKASIEESVANLPDSYHTFPSLKERYFTSFYSPKEHVEVMLHSNRLCLVGLAPEHPALMSDVNVIKVDYHVSKRLNRLDCNVRGKGKKGAPVVDEKAILAILEMEDGSRHVVRSGVRGKLIEVNERLVKQPSLINVMKKESNKTEAFIAIVLVKVPEGLEHLKNTLVDLNLYYDSLKPNS